MLLVAAMAAGWWRAAKRDRSKVEPTTVGASPSEPVTATPAATGPPEVEQATAVEPKKARAAAAQAVTGASKERPYVNSLGMKFVPVAGTGVLFSIWETRVKDFAAFVEASGYDATGGMYSLDDKEKGWVQAGRTWKDPGFEQTGENAVCGVSWDDAVAFCDWLTKEERKTGRLSESQSYRLPSDLEWSAAVGLEEQSGTTPEARNQKVKGIYPWGTKWPPPAGAGNYAGSEARTGSWLSSWLTIEGYQDGYARTSPVGSFEANRYGIHDLGGNVWEWCQDWYDAEKKYRVSRGASWSNINPSTLLSSFRYYNAPEDRFAYIGFRCVLVMGSSR
jgi:formylglycine-generating enzyme required for sulfatase activity